MSNIELLYRAYSKFKKLLRDNYSYGVSIYLCFQLYSSDIGEYHGLEDELRILDKIFTDSFSMGGYRNLLEIINLACFLKINGIKVKEIPFVWQLNLNGITTKTIHHDGELTPIILSQFLYPCEFLFGEGNYGADLYTNDIFIEVGDTRVSKVVGYLKEVNKVWVIPIYKEKVELRYIYEFAKGENWDGVELWEEWERRNEYKFRSKSISKINW